MLLEMQNAMNNMMSGGGSQLHAMLHAHQGPSDDSSLPSSSSSSDSSSCSGPSSPQCPQDSESVTSMDTSSSSASSCSSDSGEDEAPVSRPRPGAFAYRQQSPSLASPALVAVPTGAEEQESWTCWNKNTAAGACRRGPNVINAAHRQEACDAYQQQRHSAPCRESAEDGTAWHEFNRHAVSRGNGEPSSCPKNRARLVTDFVFSKHVVPFKSKVKG